MKVRVKLLVHWWCQRECIGTMINAFDVRLMIKFRLHLIIHVELHVKGHFKDLYKDPVGAPEIVLKG